MLSTRWWDLAAIVVASVIVVLTLIEPPYGADEFGAWAATGAFLVVYFAYGRRFIDGAPMQHHLVIAFLFAAILAVGTAFEPAFAILQAFLFPFVWTTAPNLRSALVANIAIAVAIVVGYTARLGPAGILTGVGIAVLSVGFSIALGLWITRIAAVRRGAGAAPRRAAGRAGPARGDASRGRRDRRTGAPRPRDPRHHRAEPHRPRDGRAAGGQPPRRGRRRGRGIRARRHRAHGADGTRGAHRGARARRLAHAGRGRRRPRRGAATARDRRSSARRAWRSR